MILRNVQRRWAAWSMAKKTAIVGAGAIILAWAGVALFAAMQTWVAAQLRGQSIPIFSTLLELARPTVVWAVATPAILWSARRFPLFGRRWAFHLVFHFAAATAFVLLLNLMIRIPGNLARADWSALWGSSLAGFVRYYNIVVVVYLVIVGLGHISLYLEIMRKRELATSRLRAEAAEARLEAMRMQLQPHFLFNALNAIGQLIRIGRASEAGTMVERLGVLLRSALRKDDGQEITVREEIECARAYVTIEEARFGDRLRVTWDVDERVLEALVPQLVLQPLIENAIRHGVAKDSEAGEVTITVTESGGRLRVTVRDDGPGLSALGATESEAGIGLRNTRERLQQLYGDRQDLTMREAPNGGTEVVIEAPYHLSQASLSRSNEDESD
ncbi:MAG: histidine kinase [Gemmatimonadales bacterium]|jgi:signal transduction histidine kinase